MSIQKLIIPVAGLGTRFLPLSKVVPKELWPLVDKPVIQYIIEEARASGIQEVIFVIKPGGKLILDYFKKSLKIEKILKERKKEQLLAGLKRIEELARHISFSYVFQKEPLGDGHAVLQAHRAVGGEPCALSWADDVVESDVPCLLQLARVFKTCKKPVIALCRLPAEKLSSYGVVEVEKIANRFFKIRKIVEKPKPGEAPSDLAIVGKYILTPEVFDELKEAAPSGPARSAMRSIAGGRGELILAEVLAKMLKDGKMIYGYEFKGKWLECGNKTAWLQSHLYLSLKHPVFGPELKKHLT